MEEFSFKNHVKRVPTSQTPLNAKIIFLHIVYKINYADDKLPMLKVNISSHGNKDSQKAKMKFECAMCSLFGSWFVMLLAVVRRCCAAKVDIKLASLQTGNAKNEVSVCQPHKFQDRRHC